MFRVPSYFSSMSDRLSEVLDDIGVNWNEVIKRRRNFILMEKLEWATNIFCNYNVRVSYFGSQVEGTTTLGLQSDIDIVCCELATNVIQDLNEWKPGHTNLLMIKDEAPSQGYVYLQYLRDDKPLPLDNASNPYIIRDHKNRLLLSNTIVKSLRREGYTRNGPALTESKPGYSDKDMVCGLICESWFTYARPLQTLSCNGQWPPNEINDVARKYGCFVVPIGCKESETEELEWRVSTSVVENNLMYSLNITQIRCYILMKMIRKEFIETKYRDIITSFICKTVLFHCIARTHPYIWNESNLMNCLTLCLMVLRKFILDKHCPHFIIPGNNLMRGRFTTDVHYGLLEFLNAVINSKGAFLLDIETDQLGFRLMAKSGILYRPLQSKIDRQLTLSRDFTFSTALCVNGCHRLIIEPLRNYTSKIALRHLFWSLFRLKASISSLKDLERISVSLLEPLLNTTLGCVLASRSIDRCNTVSLEALGWFSTGFDSDVSSSRLKLASAFYCAGDIQGSENFVTDVQNRYDETLVRNACSCNSQIGPFGIYETSEFDRISIELNEKAIRVCISFCVKFLRSEINCIPKELKYEMFRKTKDQFNTPVNDAWLEFVEVDSLPYLYFLKYKIYGFKGLYDKQKVALTDLIRVTETTPRLGHKETAFNLIGQCLEQENCVHEAFKYYLKSLKIRRVNAANVHICRLISTLFSRRSAKIV